MGRRKAAHLKSAPRLILILGKCCPTKDGGGTEVGGKEGWNNTEKWGKVEAEWCAIGGRLG